MSKLLEKVDAIEPRIREIRKTIHANPEGISVGKRAAILIPLLSLTWVLLFSGCSHTPQESTQPQADSISNIEVPASSLSDTETTTPAAFPEDIRMSQGTLYTLTEGDETAAITRYDYAGTTLDSVTVPLMPEPFSR